MLVKGQMKVCYPKLYNFAHANLHLLNVLLLPKDQIIAFSIVLLQLVSCHVAPPKSHPVFHLQCRLYFSLDHLGSIRIFELFQKDMLSYIFLTLFI